MAMVALQRIHHVLLQPGLRLGVLPSSEDTEQLAHIEHE